MTMMAAYGDLGLGRSSEYLDVLHVDSRCLKTKPYTLTVSNLTFTDHAEDAALVKIHISRCAKKKTFVMSSEWSAPHITATGLYNIKNCKLNAEGYTIITACE
jgi:hypothetical protein